MEKFDFFDKEDLKQIPLFYSNIFKIKKDLIDKIEKGVRESTYSQLHRSKAYQRYSFVSPVSLVKLDEIKSDYEEKEIL
ncbi:MAG: hypothetical protein K0R59_2009 [Sphingobacterium sp.]|jgi:hypothetical protein|nr:hypothetical protein [Sphingobacterium sp.]